MRNVTLTEAVARKVVEAVAGGNFLDVAFALAGVPREVMTKWIVKGKAGAEPYASLMDAIAEAEAECEQTALAALVSAAKVEPKVAREFLAARFPERWSEKRTLVHELPATLTDERLRARLREVGAGLPAEVREALGSEWIDVAPPRDERH